ncbi:MAG: MraY family glycosyltransferase [Acidimicrobiia bacterium]
MGGYALVFGVAAGVTWLFTWVVRWAAPRIGAVSMPDSDSRHTHSRPTPTLGGAAMFVGLLAAMLVASRMNQFHEMFDSSSEPLGVLLAAGIMFVVGALDDMREVSPPAKISGQALSGAVLSLMGVTMLYFRIPFAASDFVVLSPDLAPLITVAWVVVMANAINLIDGLDGLAAGIVVIAGTALFIFADRLFEAGLLDGSNIAPLVAVIAVGMAAGFLPHNLSPARIFMGDAGSMLLGLMLAVATITVGGRVADQFSGQTYFFFAPLAIPIVILGVPILDAVWSFLRRVARRKSVATPDQDHLHHRLVRLGHGPRRSVVILWAWTAVLSGLVLVPTFTNEGNAMVPFGVAALALLLYVYFHPSVRTERALAAEREMATDPVAGDHAGDHAGARPGDEQIVDLEARRRRDAG